LSEDERRIARWLLSGLAGQRACGNGGTIRDTSQCGHRSVAQLSRIETIVLLGESDNELCDDLPLVFVAPDPKDFGRIRQRSVHLGQRLWRKNSLSNVTPDRHRTLPNGSLLTPLKIVSTLQRVKTKMRDTRVAEQRVFEAEGTLQFGDSVGHRCHRLGRSNRARQGSRKFKTSAFGHWVNSVLRAGRFMLPYRSIQRATA
jgi:hypothetical protein